MAIVTGGPSVKILIDAINWVGDAIIALPALRPVRSHFPEAQITILARSFIAPLYKDHDVCNKTMLVDSTADLLSEKRAQEFALALLLQNAFEAAWLTWRAGIPERIGYARDGRGLLLTKAIPVPRTGEIPPHEKFYYLELLRRAGWIDALPDESFITLSVSETGCRRA